MKRPDKYWSSCCGALAEYIGYYRCTGCQASLNLGRMQAPHLIGDPREADRVRQQPAAPEAVVPDGCLF